ncbi:MAG: ribosomal protein S18-alanine N-acetyltransferase [Mitsuaria chitosanitabida]|uniref:ribosomal protein S18-alanine N-acetyltransferase n=1 Tax=Roseateles chitosanitabidus TaxID=65048 RepID=UPI001B0E334B|nr:ribosomal protein S18-alanine N-acetyltransferase [Roseateles chitosanitabidus]MBO9689290.1 ribosomal protein S18-alanine N-acetyltransferase [Roseateles chitosanitabidus]
MSAQPKDLSWPASLQSLQPLRAVDLDEVMAIETVSYSHPWTRGNFIDSLAAGYAGFVMRDEQARLCAYFLAMQVIDEMHLLNITVIPERQGQGLARRMLDALGLLSRARGCHQIWLEVRESNVRARQLYDRYGFAQSGLRRNYYPADGGREDAILMTLRLTEPAA